ncbi:DMT family transporter [Olleya sp. Hel_I_94]|uniref:DMT family transporter n=1 Tax=Olleya sp. Hel_I_94 TaxID=1250001 RepID=UPI00119FDEFE|nr:DMT family transporter [Olleya sp. Hel_I_94]TVZ49590.1 putative membrane protein [Olleya sp. Hel_I_94]|tara:strand:+ start:188621 stop:189529 length:909 start_codon:yes stop_codon:yes gene_type:complete
MQNDKLKNYLHLHVLVFIAGFTAIIGKLITINAVSLVWYRMLMATVLMFIYIKIAKVDISITKKALIKLSIAGVIIALHWITFFGAIQVANASIALAMFSTGAFFASFIEPIIYKRKIIAYEIVFGLIVILGVYLIVKSEFKYIDGMILGIISAFLSSLFAVLNGKFLEEHSATKISFYEFLSGVFFISLYILLFGDGFNLNHFNISLSDGLWLFVLASVCTAYAFIASVYVMRYISPYTVVLTYNLEPIYGIILALMLFPESETMSPSFYIGAFIILGVVLLNGVLKNLKKIRKNKSPQTN